MRMTLVLGRNGRPQVGFSQGEIGIGVEEDGLAAKQEHLILVEDEIRVGDQHLVAGVEE